MTTPAANKFFSSRALLLTTTVLVAAVLAVIIFFVGSKIFGENDGLASDQETRNVANSATTLPTGTFAAASLDSETNTATNATELTATTLPIAGSETSTNITKPANSPETPKGTASTSQPTNTRPVTPQPDNGKPYMHITFDDGPHELTIYVLNMLAKHNVQATFFIQGQTLEQKPEIARQALNAGHAIGNHSYKHDGWKTIGISAAKADMIKTQGVIQNTLGITPSCARAPFGDDSPEVVAALAELGMDHWEWDLDPKEWESGRDGRLKNLLDNPSSVPKLTNTDGYILLLHDSHPSLQSAIDTLDAWIAANKDNYQFTAIPGCLNYQ